MMNTRITRLARHATVTAVVTVAVVANQFDPASATTAGRPHHQPEPTLSLSARERGPSATASATPWSTARASCSPATTTAPGTCSSPPPVDTDDGTTAGPGACETAVATMSAYGVRGIDFTMIGGGDVCGVHPQPPTSIITYVFTGTDEIYDATSRPHRFIGTDSCFEVRLADNHTAAVLVAAN